MTGQGPYKDLVDSESFTTRIWSGLYSPEEVIEFAVEGLTEGFFGEDIIDEPDEELVRQLVEGEFEKKAQAEKAFPSETDCDRLTKAFRKLTTGGIIAMENAGYTTSDGWSDFQEVVATEWESPAARKLLKGGCFYHGQDLERGVAGLGLNIAFGATTGSNAESIAIAQEIVSVLKSFGFAPTWDGTEDQRIFMPIKWQRRLGPAADTTPP